MKIQQVSEQFSISDQLEIDDLATLEADGVEVLICNRPDGEAARQPAFEIIAAAAAARGIEAHRLAFKSGELKPAQIKQLASLLATGRKTHAYCRTGNRSFQLYVAAQASSGASRESLTGVADRLGMDISRVLEHSLTAPPPRSRSGSARLIESAKQFFDVVIVGAGSGGIAVAASLKKRNSKLRIVLIDPAREHFYQPGWTMVGGGVFDASTTRRKMKDLIPRDVRWLQQAVRGFNPDASEVILDDESTIAYGQLIVCPGLKLDWQSIDGLESALGKNGVTSNYLYHLAPYTWELVKSTRAGRAVFTQPPMPIKCAGAPQKAMYLSCDYWRRQHVLETIDVHFFNAGGVLFGVKDYLPALESYIERYGIRTHYNHVLKAVDGDRKVARFETAAGDGQTQSLEVEFDLLHVCPPQKAPDFVASSVLADQAGWLDVDQFTLRHKRYGNIWGLGDVMNAPNAKTMAAVRKQVPVVADNLLAVMAGHELPVGYDGYGSCPLTVERGKIVLAEFGYGGKLEPTFPTWLLHGTRPTRAAWFLKANVLPGIYWQAMLKGREWLATPKPLDKVRT